MRSHKKRIEKTQKPGRDIKERGTKNCDSEKALRDQKDKAIGDKDKPLMLLPMLGTVVYACC